MKIIYNNLIPFPGYAIMNLFGILFVRKGVKVTEKVLNHERIHTAQMKEMLWIGFYLWYGIEYIIVRLSGLFKGKGQNWSYHDISLEEEAYQNDDNPEYLKTRKHYSWTKYLSIGSYEGRN